MSPRRRMLVISPAAPWPATTGGLVRIAEITRQLARHFDVTFVTPLAPGQTPADWPLQGAYEPLNPPGALRRAAALLSLGRPYHAAMYFQGAVRESIRRHLSRAAYDAVYSHFIYGLEYLQNCPVPVIVDQQNVDRLYWSNKAEHSPFPVSLFAGFNTWRTVRYETRHLRSVWAYVSVSDADRERTRAYAAPLVEHFWVAPNGVDTTRFTPAAAADSDGAITVGYLGSMDLQMNVEAVERFATDLLPDIRRRTRARDVRFLVIGRNPAPAIRAVSARTPGMILSGTVDDVLPWLHRVHILVCPLRIGAGTKLKVAEAMACGLPVVGTSLAFAGLSGASGTHYVEANEREAFVEAVVALADDPARRRAIGDAARALAVTTLDWNAVGDALAHDVETGLQARGARA